MNITKYLIITPGRKKRNPAVKIVNSLKGTMAANSVAIHLNLDLPDALFEKPQLQATIKINEADVNKPVINAQVLDNIKREFQKMIGVDMNINIVEPKEEGEN